MITIPSYKPAKYPELQKVLNTACDKTEKTHLQIAADINVKSVATISNALKNETQTVSDQVLTNIMTSVGISGIIVWDNGERYYYLKNGK